MSKMKQNGILERKSSLFFTVVLYIKKMSVKWDLRKKSDEHAEVSDEVSYETEFVYDFSK